MLETGEFEGRMLLGLSRPFISATLPNSNASEVIGPLWGQMSKLYFSLALARSENPIGVGAMWRASDFAETGSMIYFAGYEVNEIPEELGGLEPLILESSKYAYVEHIGPISNLPQVITNFYTKLLPESNLPRKIGIDLEIYHESLDSDSPPRVVIAAPLQQF